MIKGMKKYIYKILSQIISDIANLISILKDAPSFLGSLKGVSNMSNLIIFPAVGFIVYIISLLFRREKTHDPEISIQFDNTYQLAYPDERHCKIFFKLKAKSKYEYGQIKLNFANTVLKIKQSKNKEYLFKFIIDKVRNENVEIQPGGYFVYDMDFAWEKEGQSRDNGPDLDCSFTWEIEGLKAILINPELTEIPIKKIKGERLAKVYGS